MPAEVRPIEWAFMSPKAQAWGRCRYCDERAEFMHRVAEFEHSRGYAPYRRGYWVPLCTTHAEQKRTKGETT